MGNELCAEHSGVCERIKGTEVSIQALWKKWDNVQKLVIASLTALCLNLIGVIVILIKVF